jgi:hypothetical protein
MRAALLVLALVGCARPEVPGTWTATGAPQQEHWEVVVAVALELSPCHVGKGSLAIVFHDAPFECYPNAPGRLCNGLTSYHRVDINGAQTADVTFGTLPYEAANTLAQLCWDEYDETPRMQALAVRIAEEARARIGALP